MKIKTNPQFEVFRDGKCNIYSPDDDGELVAKYQDIDFGNEILGYKRFYSAMSANNQLERVIRIPQLRDIISTDRVQILGVTLEISQVQHIDESYPKKTVITLKQAV